jgi:hypothetical protein
MTFTLNHAIVPAMGNRQAARFFASVMGPRELPPAGRTGKFAPVRVDEQLTLDFMTVGEPAGLHLAFDVAPATFDRIWARLRAAGIPFGNHAAALTCRRPPPPGLPDGDSPNLIRNRASR